MRLNVTHDLSVLTRERTPESRWQMSHATAVKVLHLSKAAIDKQFRSDDIRRSGRSDQFDFAFRGTDQRTIEAQEL